MRIEPMALSEALARAHTGNPKEHDVEALAASIVRFGFKAPPTIDEASGVMVAGHGRCMALQLLHERTPDVPPEGITVGDDGQWMIPIVRGLSFVSDRERDAYVIADNQHTIAGGWDLDKLQASLGSLDDFDGLGFDSDELQALISRDAIEPDDRGDDAPPADEPKPTVTHDINVATTYRCPSCGHEWTKDK